MTTIDTDAGALEAMLSHHAALADGVARRVGALRAAAEGHARHETAAAELVAYLAEEVLPHAEAEEGTFYRAAAAKADLAETVAGMIDEHRQLISLVEQLATAGDASGALRHAEAIGSLFARHVTKENELVLPPLAADEAVDLAGLLAEMHRRTEAAKREAPATEGAAAPDAEATLVRLLLRAASQLADAGQGDAACTLAAEAWTAVRASRPELAVRVTAALHRLVRSVAAEPVSLSPGRPAPRDGSDALLDVRALAPAQRHEKIFATYGALGPGTGFVLVNDHDPRPLRYQFEAEHAGRFTWDVLEAGPTVWRVRIARPAETPDRADDAERGTGAAAGEAGAGASATGAEPELDVRRFPHGQRHDVIFAAFDALAEGTGFVLVNDHDPRPLRYQFEAEHAGRYSWDYLEAGPEVWRVRIGRLIGAQA